ncbi:MAG: hypothetical protein KA248_10840 [Kiritimatiellae bacterium]|nr:hypothetical protein [Kiritimatiellia bacterium]
MITTPCSSPAPQGTEAFPWINRRFALAFFSLVTALSGVSFVAGVRVLREAPYLGIQVGSWNQHPTVFHYDETSAAHDLLSQSDTLIEINGIPLKMSDFLHYPEFFSRGMEREWWAKAAALHQRLSSDREARLVTLREDGTSASATLPLRRMPWRILVQRTAISYISAVLCLIIGASVLVRAADIHRFLIALLSANSALYLICMTALRTRDLVLPSAALRLLVNLSYFGAAGCLTLIHFAMVFPQPLPLLRRHPNLALLPYLFMMLSCILYYSGLTAFGFTFPFLIIWLLVAAGSFAYSYAREKDPLPKEIILMTMTPPAIVLTALVLLALLPAVLRARPIDFTYYSLIVPILPFTLWFGAKSYALYLEKKTAVEQRIRERDYIARELHDHLSNDLTAVSLCSQEARDSLGQASPVTIASLLDTILERTQKSFWLVRDFITSFSPEDCSWSGLIAQMENFGYRTLPPLHMRLDLEVSVDRQNPMNALTYLHLFGVFKELLTNAMKYSDASVVRVRLEDDRAKGLIRMTVKDDGKGCELDRPWGRGLHNIQRRASELGGTAQFESQRGQGFQAIVETPRLHI